VEQHISNLGATVCVASGCSCREYDGRYPEPPKAEDVTVLTKHERVVDLKQAFTDLNAEDEPQDLPSAPEAIERLSRKEA
jgi:hypothetical protein